MAADSYTTLKSNTPESIFKDRGSKFIAYGFPTESDEEAKMMIKNLWLQHPKASHICYAWQLGTRYEQYRVNDDGEPNNSAGMPIYGQIQSAGLTQVVVAVVRYYGGTNLGVGGLISAYKTSAKMTLESGKTVKRTIKSHMALHFDYPQMNDAMRIIKEQNLKTISQELHLDCTIILAIRQSKLHQIKERFDLIKGITTKIL